MPALTIAQGTAADLDDVLALLQTAGLLGNGVAGQIGNFLIAREDGRLVAVAGLEDHRVELAEVNPAALASGQFQGQECESTAVMVLDFN